MAVWARGNAARVSLILRATCAAGVCAAVYGIAQYFGWDPILPASGYEAGEGPFRIVRPPGPLGHSDYFAAFLVWPVFFGWNLARCESGVAWRTLGWTAALSGSAAILFSGSRGAALGLLVAGALLTVLQHAPWRKLAGVSAIAVLTLGAIYVSPVGGRLRARAHWIQEEPLGGARFLLWKDSVRMAGARPWTGFGPDNFAAEFPRYESAALARAYPDFYHESPHNLWLDTLTGDGTPTLFAQLAAVALALISGVRAKRGGPRSVLLAALVGVLVAHEFAVFTAVNALFFYLGAALLVGLKEEPEPSPPRTSNMMRGLAIATATAAGVDFCLVAFRVIQADATLGTAKRLLDNPDRRGAVNAYQRAVKLRSTGVTADLYFSRAWARLGAASPDVLSRLYFSQMAAESASLAVESAEQRQNGWYNRAEIAAMREDAPALETSLRSAVDAAPDWYKPHWALARFFYQQGRLPEAQAEARRVADLYGGTDEEIAATLTAILGPRLLPQAGQ